MCKKTPPNLPKGGGIQMCKKTPPNLPKGEGL